MFRWLFVILVGVVGACSAAVTAASARDSIAPPGVPVLRFQPLPAQIVFRGDGQIGAPTMVTWAVSPDPSTCSYRLWQQKNSKPWIPAGGSSSTTPSTYPEGRINHPIGDAYRFAVAAADCQGAVSAMTYGPQTRIQGYQDGTAKVTGTWTTVHREDAWGGTVRQTTAAGAAATFTVRGRSIAVVMMKGPAEGAADIYIDGKLRSTVDTQAPVPQPRQYVLRWASSNRSHTVRVVNHPQGGRSQCTIDGIVTLVDL